MSDLFSIPLTRNDGSEHTLGEWAEHLLLVVNTASECGFTDQYDGLQALFEEYAARGFFVLAFPSNDFGAQEPGTDADIAEFCRSEFGVEFPIFAKTQITGAHAHPLFHELSQVADNHGEAGEVAWNFEKFLIDPKGKIVGRFRSAVAPEAEELRAAIEAHLPL